MENLIEIESKTEEGNKIHLDSPDQTELYIVINNLKIERTSIIRLDYEQVRLFTRALNIWIDTGKKEN